jgi:superfamily II DNA/RNA helicase
MKFSELDLDPKVLQAVEESGYTVPTPIQAEAIPEALKGRDVLGIAQTGTGKTAGFVLPMITMLAKGRARARMPRSLILCPTRELAAQVAENFEKYGKYHKLTMALLIGGVSFKDQDKLIDRGVDVLIATPGRLLDHFERGKLMLTGVQIMVVDEADRMLDMGFIPDIERIFKLTPFTRQTLFFSATMPPEITRLTQEFLHNPVRVEVSKQASTAETVTQGVFMFRPSKRDRETASREKRACLRALMTREGDKLRNAIIFCNRKTEVSVLHKSLVKYGYNAGALHGDLDQSVRTATLNGFRDGSIKLLVASDVAARGLDIPNVSHVFNFDVPIHAEDYVHRIGRTGRAGREGTALTICAPLDQKYLDRIEELVGNAIPVLDALEGQAAAPADAEEGAEEPRKRARAPRRGRASDKPRDEGKAESPKAKAEPANQPAAETPAEAVAESPAEPTVERRADNRAAQSREESKPRGGRGPREDRRDKGHGGGHGGKGGGNRGGGKPVVGMGDHVPAFLMREVRPVPAADDAANDIDEGDDGPHNAGAAA